MHPSAKHATRPGRPAGKRPSAAPGRAGFTVLEISLALMLMVVVMGLVAQAASWALLERGRLATQQEALLTATNLLETARATPWDALTSQWAAAQRLPETLSRLQPDAKLQVSVEPQKSAPRSKRVTVEIQWNFRPGMPNQELRLETVLSAREASS